MSSTTKSPYETYNFRSGCLISHDSLQQVEILKTWLLRNLTTEKYVKDTRKKSKTANEMVPKYRYLAEEYGQVSLFKHYAKDIAMQLKTPIDQVYKGLTNEGKKADISFMNAVVLKQLFKTAEPTDPESSFDTKRYSMVEDDMVNHPNYSEIKEVLEKIKNQVLHVCQQQDKRMKLATYTVLFSSKGGEPQGLHLDEQREECPIKDAVQSVIVSLEPGTKLDFSDSLENTARKTFYLPGPGSLFWFNGKQLHGGSAYPDAPNIRLHFYVHFQKDVISFFKMGNRAILHQCEHEECSQWFLTKDARSTHYRKDHTKEWYSAFKSKRKEESLKKQKENKTLHQRKWRSNKKIKLLENVEGNESENDSETSDNNTNN